MFVLVLLSTTGRGIPALSVKVILACSCLASVCAWDMQKRVWDENLLCHGITAHYHMNSFLDNKEFHDGFVKDVISKL
jgi:hypothetical protein